MANPLNEQRNLALLEESGGAVEGTKPPLLQGFIELPKSRQLGIIVAVALTLAVAVAVALWSQRGDYRRLFVDLPEKEAGNVVETLAKWNVDYRLDAASGAILVPADKVHELRLKLASLGLPREGHSGFELLDKDNGFGSSQLVESARYQRALEGEIARSIMTIRDVKSARVHLALPKDSVFVRQAKKPSASVVVELPVGRVLEAGQVEAVVHLVASSVPQLQPSQVTVVDQLGRLLSSSEQGAELEVSSKQFAYKRQVEDHLIQRVENILTPVAGRDSIRTQIAADIDFTVTERTQEVFNPDSPSIRSEQTHEEQNRSVPAQGVPGALTNQPPPAGVAPELAGQTVSSPGGGTAADSPVNTSKSATRNFEVDKTISHSRLSAGDIRRLTVAVVLDHQRIRRSDGSVDLQPYSNEDLNQFTALVKEAVGYDATRGDRVTVTNAPFRIDAESVPGEVFWEQTWFDAAVKQGTLILALLLVTLGVLRPLAKGLIDRGTQDKPPPLAADASIAGARLAETGRASGTESAAETENRLSLGRSEEVLLLEAPQSYEKRLELAQRTIDKDPRRVAQVIKTWMSGNG